jgi:hypothetical protein
MASASAFLIIMITINVGLLFFQGFDSGGTSLVKLVTINSGTEKIEVGNQLQSNLVGLLSSLLGSLATAGLVYVASPEHALYAAIVTFMMAFATLPLSIFYGSGLPFMVQVVIGVPLVIGYIFAMVGFFRGYEP